METNRTGNLERFFGKEKEEYGFLRTDLLLQGQGDALEEKAAQLLAGGKHVVLYGNNPYSVHAFSQGLPDDTGKDASYAQLHACVERLRARCGAFAKWYFPYPAVEFPSAVFSEDRLPQKGECDETYYHFGQARMEALNEPKTVDSLVESGMFEMLAFAYMVVLSKDEQVLAGLPSYTRFSNERRTSCQIRTDLYADHVEKTALHVDAAEHICRMEEWENRLGCLLAPIRIMGRECQVNRLLSVRKDKMQASFAFADGESMEAVLDDMVSHGNACEAADALLEVCAQLRMLAGETPFVQTAAFETVFGSLQEHVAQSCHSLPVSDIDLVPQNILLAQQAVVIDYEWTFDFPVPVEYIIFRFIYFYLEAKDRDLSGNAVFSGLYAQAGITEEMRTCFLAMETHFQLYVQSGAAVLRNAYDLHGGAVLKRCEIERQLSLLDEGTLLICPQEGEAFPVSGKAEQDGITTYRFRPGQSRHITITEQNTASSRFRLLRIGALGVTEGAQTGISCAVDAQPCGGLLYSLEEKPLHITLTLEKEEEWVLLSIEEIRLSEPAFSELVQSIRELRFLVENREQQIEQLKNSASWKLTRPLRAVSGIAKGETDKKQK